MLHNMSQHAEITALTWSELGMSELLPTGTVTLLLADVEGSTGLWETEPDQMSTALAQLNRIVNDSVGGHDGVRPLEQGEGDSFVAAFARASDAVACALALQQAPLEPIRLRIGVHTGEIQLRDDANYAGPTINRTARLRDLAHGGQTVLSGVTESLVADRLPDGVWLIELGSYPLRGVARPERVVQLCHPGLRNEFPPLRVRGAAVSHNLPVQLTSFIGRQREMAELRDVIAPHRLVTLTGAGGAGKTRLAVEVASERSAEFDDGVWCVDLAPITIPEVVPVTVARTLGLPDQPGRSTMELLTRFFGQKKTLLLLDNCEHLLDACVLLVEELLRRCPHLTIIATSREPLGVTGELSWRVPSLSVADEAVELFTDRARRIRPDFVVTESNRPVVVEICRRLDGMPLAIELAAARVRALSLHQILDSLHDRFRLLTGGARTSVRRQQTLRASVDWSHALLTDPERVLFRRLAVFAGGFDLAAAQAVGAGSELESYQLLDQLSLLVDKSLVVASETSTDTGMRYGMLETVRQYAQEKLGESGEADEVRTRHRDYYADTAAALEASGHAADDVLLRWAQREMDNLRAAFAWSRESADLETALRLILSLRPLWIRGGRIMEALAGLDAVLADGSNSQIAPEVWVGAVAYRGILAAFGTIPSDMGRQEQALAVARRLGNTDLVARALIACGMSAIYSADLAEPYFAEAIGLVRASGDQWSECQIVSHQATAYTFAAEPLPARATAERARDLADALGDRFFSRNARAWLGLAVMMQGHLTEAGEIACAVAREAEAAKDLMMIVYGHVVHGIVLAYQGKASDAYAAVDSALRAVDALGGVAEDTALAVLATACLADGDGGAGLRFCEAAWKCTNPLREMLTRSVSPIAEAALACGDLTTARRWADENVAMVPGWQQLVALTARAHIAMAQGDPEQAERDAHDALAVAARTQGYLRVPDTLECLARLAAHAGNTSYAARLCGAADAMRQRTGQVRFPMYQPGYDSALAHIRDTVGQDAFEAAWAEGAALSTEEAIAYAKRGRGERKRPTTGWASLTPMERDVVRLVVEGLSNKEIGARLFISPRTVQSHLTHVYAKLGIASRVQLVQQASRLS
ncbi:LuxR family transcriptional regulator [Mycobacterium kubicae]|uniref:helix-turn-helix transcriptional regulator n=1 Tax=Mycobacterium kubicae TaxID=120959 RepID=UPI000AEC79A1